MNDSILLAQLNSFIDSNLIGAYHKLSHLFSPLRLTAALCVPIRRSKTITNRRGSAQLRGTCQNQQFLAALSLLRLNFLKFFKAFFLKVGMLYNIFEAFHPTPSTKGTLFIKISLCKN